MRLFIAITLADEIRKSLASVQSEVQQCYPNIRLVNPDNIHLTLRFLGEVSEDKLDELFQTLSLVDKHPVFDFSLINIGAFPLAKKPQIIWVGCKDTNLSLGRIFKTIETGLINLDFQPNDHKFSAHITLGRNKTAIANRNFYRLIETYNNKEIGRQPVNKIDLYQSTLTSEGPIYTIIRDFSLRK